MRVTLKKQFRFEASHRLQHLPPTHPCHNLHGHGYAVEIEVSGEVNLATGFLIDYADISKAVMPFINQLDHSHLNDIEGLTITSTEFIAEWLWKRLKPSLPTLSAITISETPSTSCTYRGE